MTEEPLKYKKEKDVFKCLLCGYLTPKLSTMRDHIYKRKRPCNMKTQYNCPKCLKVFALKSTFQDHLNRKTLCVKNLNAPINSKCNKSEEKSND